MSTRNLESGRYRLNIEVTDNNNNAFYYVVNNDINIDELETTNKTESYSDLFVKSQQKCCGSSVFPSTKLSTKLMGTFRRSIVGPVVHLTYLSEDQVPPAKIGDLKIRQLAGASNPDRLLAEWTAPGGDYDVGSVASYRFVFSQNIEDLIDPIKGEPEVLLGFDRIERAGTVAKFDFNFPHYDQDFYVGAYGFDMAGNRGKISNLVHVRVSSPTSVYVNPRSSDDPTLNLTSSPDPDWIIIGSICGVISVLLILAISSITYYIYVSRKRTLTTGSTSSVMGGAVSDETDASSFDSDIKTISASMSRATPPKQSDYQEISSGCQQIKTTTVVDSLTNVTPVYWSASQLLSKLEYNSDNSNTTHATTCYMQQPQSLQPQNHQQYLSDISNTINHHQPVSLHNSMPLWSYRVRDIPEEYTVTVSDMAMNDYPMSGGISKPPRNITQV